MLPDNGRERVANALIHIGLWYLPLPVLSEIVRFFVSHPENRLLLFAGWQLLDCPCLYLQKSATICVQSTPSLPKIPGSGVFSPRPHRLLPVAAPDEAPDATVDWFPFRRHDRLHVQSIFSCPVP